MAKKAFGRFRLIRLRKLKTFGQVARTGDQEIFFPFKRTERKV